MTLKNWGFNNNNIFLEEKLKKDFLKMVQQNVCPVHSEYAVMNRQELYAFFLEKRRENINFYKN